MFESLLLQRLYSLKGEERVFVEGESRRIGRVVIPLHLWQAMQKAKKIKIVCPTQERVERLYKEYCENFDLTLMSTKIGQIQKFLGKAKADALIVMLHEGKVKEVVDEILVHYYDQLYKHTVDSKEYSFEVKNREELLACFS